ncbi:uncharacterized protein [Diadema antillarum]|uniref:uncharacterized protein n=1 Tax=Diadema antillarum TaxID=105358 RepID=UPI003A874B0D
MWIVQSLMEVAHNRPRPVGPPAAGGDASWEGGAPTLMPPSSALSPWIQLRGSQGMMPPGVGQKRRSLVSGQLHSTMSQFRAVGTVEKIDSYFQKYQTGHYQPNQVMPHHTPPPGSTIPVVRTDAQDSGIEDTVDSVPGPRNAAQQYVRNVLSDQELMVYRHALLCAQFPVLGSRLPGLGRRTRQSPPTPAHPRGATAGPSSSSSSLLATPPPSPGSLSGDGEDDDSMVQEETLCVLVKEAFQLSEERHLFYDDHIAKGLGNKPPAKLLVEELMGRLSLLQANSLPYYQPQAFETRNAYDLWQQQEVQLISALIHQFWRGPLPNLDPLVCKASYWASVHDMYRDLLVLLFKHDKALKAGPATGCPLLSSSRRLLREFSLHYGVGEIYRRITYLEYLVSTEMFEGVDWYLRHLSQTLRGIQDVFTKHQARVTLVRTEYEMLCRALSSLKDRCCSQLEKLLQQRSPNSRVVCLITLLSETLDLKMMLEGRLHDDIQTMITHSLKESVQCSYNGQKLILTTELRLNAYTTPVSPELISKLIVHIQSEILYFQENYRRLFQLYHIEVMETVVTTFYTCLMADVSVLCDKVEARNSSHDTEKREYIDPAMVSMARRLDRLDQDWKEYIPSSTQEWRKALTSSAVHWFQYLIRDIQAMLVYSIARDQFKTVQLKFSQDVEGANASDGGHHRPSNATQLTQSIGSAFASVVPRDQQRENYNNNDKPQPATQQDSTSSGLSFTPTGVLNFKRPVRTKSFPQIDELIHRTDQWSLVRDSQTESVADSARDQAGPSTRTSNLEHSPDSNLRAASAAPSQTDLTHSQSFPELSAASFVQSRAAFMAGRQSVHRGRSASGKDQLTNSSSSHHRSERANSSDADNSLESSSSSSSMSASSSYEEGQIMERGQERETLRAIFEQLGLFSGDGTPCSHVALPISSSLVDMVYIIRNTCDLMQDICQVLNPKAMVTEQAGVKGQRATNQLMIDLQQLMISPLQAVTFAVRVFGSNMLAMDLCATPVLLANQIINKEVMNRLLISQNAGLLGSCRHDRSGLPDCNAYLNPDKECLCDNYEPISPEMCLRINNIQGLIELLPDLLPSVSDFMQAGGCSQSPSSSSSEVGDSGSSHDIHRPLQRYLQNLLISQIKVLTFKVNAMLSQALRVLLQLNPGSFNIATKLHPLVASIHNHLVATTTWLYPPCFQLFCLELWKSLVKNFNELAEDLLLQHTEDRPRAMLILQAIAHLMETMNNHSVHGLNADMLLEPAKGVIQILQLYTWPTRRLIELYQELLNRAWKGTAANTSPIKPQTLKRLQQALCQKRKCFSGTELIQALAHFQTAETVENVWDLAHQTAEELVRCGLVRRMMAGGHTLDVSSLQGGSYQYGHEDYLSDREAESYVFPEVTLHSIPRTSAATARRGSTTPGDTTDNGSNDRLSRRLTMSEGSEGGGGDNSDEVMEDQEGSAQIVEVVVEVHSSSQMFSGETDDSERGILREESRPTLEAGETPDGGGGGDDEEVVAPSLSTTGVDEESGVDESFADHSDDQGSAGLQEGEAPQSGTSEATLGSNTNDAGDGPKISAVPTPETESSSPPVSIIQALAESALECQAVEEMVGDNREDRGSETRISESTSVEEKSTPSQVADTQASSERVAPCDQAIGEASKETEKAEDTDRVAPDSRQAESSVSQSSAIQQDSGGIEDEVSGKPLELSQEGRSELNEHSYDSLSENGRDSFEGETGLDQPGETGSSSGQPTRPRAPPPTAGARPKHTPASQRALNAFAPVTDLSSSDSSDMDETPSSGSHSPNAATGWSAGGVATFTADAQQLYCFSQVYDVSATETAEGSHPGSRPAGRLADNLEEDCSPELVIAIISSRRDDSAKDFINQVGDESVFVKEASCIKRLCKACFKY